jgi:hypothetical protein
MLDKNDWKTDNKAWVAEREVIWKKLLPLMRYKLESGDDRDPKKCILQAKAFFDGTNIEFPVDEAARINTPFWAERILMHPNPTVENIRYLFSECNGRRDEMNRFPFEFSLIQGYFAPLVKGGVIKSEFIDNFVTALWGNSLNEAMEIWELVVVHSLYGNLDHLMGALFGWAFERSNLDCDYFPYERLLKLLLEMLLLVDDEVAPKLNFKLKRIFRAVKNIENMETADLPRRRDFIEKFKQGMIEQRDSLHPNFWPYIDSLTENNTGE